MGRQAYYGINMNWNVISGIVDRIVLVGVTWLASKGYIASGEVTNIVAAVMAILGAIWGYWVNRPQALLAATASLPKVTAIDVTDEKLADSVTSEKVQATK